MFPQLRIFHRHHVHIRICNCDFCHLTYTQNRTTNKKYMGCVMEVVNCHSIPHEEVEVIARDEHISYTMARMAFQLEDDHLNGLGSSWDHYKAPILQPLFTLSTHHWCVMTQSRHTLLVWYQIGNFALDYNASCTIHDHIILISTSKKFSCFVK